MSAKNRIWVTGTAAIAALATAAAVTSACGKKKKSNDTPPAEENVLAAAFPSALAISAFPSTTTSLADTEEVLKRPVQDKLEDQEDRINGVGGDCIDPRVFKTAVGDGNKETCYEFDSDMNPFTYQTKSYGTKTGLNSSGEACLVAFAREEINRSVDMVDRALALIGGIMCQAKKDGTATELPAVDASTDLTASLTKALPTGAGMTAKAASIARMADSSAGAAVYKSIVEVTDSRGKTMTVTLVHSPGTGGAESGVLSSKVSEVDSGINDGNNTANKNRLMSINYSRETVDGKSRMRFEVRRASLLNTIEPFDANGLVNYAAIPTGAMNDTAHAMAFLAFDMDPDTNAGDLSYWRNPGGNNTEAARGFLFHVDAATDGTLSGCGVSGANASISIRKAVTDDTVVASLKPTQWWHPQWAQNTSADKDTAFTAQTGSKITKQCFTRNSAGLYTIDTAKTTGSRGYDLIEGTASTITPPPRPANKVEIKP